MSCTSYVGHEGVGLVEFIRGDVLHHSMQRVLLSGVEVLVVESEQSVCHTGLQRPWSEAKLALHKKFACSLSCIVCCEELFPQSN